MSETSETTGKVEHSLLWRAARALDEATSAVFAAPHALLDRITTHRASEHPLWHWYGREIAATRREPMDLETLNRYFDMLDQRRKLEESVSIAPRVERWLAGASSARPVTRGAREMVWAWQRVTRGWDDRSIWNLDHHLYKQLGEQLLQLAEVTPGWPVGDEFPTYEDWQTALRENGNKLLAASRMTGLEDPEDEARLRADAHDALAWVTKHIDGLWV